MEIEKKTSGFLPKEIIKRVSNDIKRKLLIRKIEKGIKKTSEEK
jgi:hypothetical protein